MIGYRALVNMHLLHFAVMDGVAKANWFAFIGNCLPYLTNKQAVVRPEHIEHRSDFVRPGIL